MSSSATRPVSCTERIVAQEFLDGVGDELGPGLEQRELVGIAMQRQQTVADQVDGGLVARAEQAE